MEIKHLRVNHLEIPLGYDFTSLTLSWKVEASIGEKVYEVRVLVSENDTMERLVYDSGLLEHFKKCQLAVKISLKPRTRYYWQVIIMDTEGNESTSEISWFETAKMDEEWKAQWISAEETSQMPVLYKDFQAKKSLKRARLYMFGAGLYEVAVNNKMAGDEYLLPGYHAYDLLMEYQTFDITELIKSGDNRISILLGEGWYKGRFGFDGDYYNLYGDKKKCIAELALEYEAGETEWIYTDESWKAESTHIGENGIYDGEHQNLMWEKKALKTVVLEDTKELLTARSNPPLRKVEEFVPVTETIHRDGYELLDFGEAITGWVEFSGALDVGQKILLQYGEVLQNGDFYRENLRTARAEFSYVSNGRERNVRPHFTFYGFRYVKVVGLREGQQLTFRAYRIMSDIEQTGWIETSNEKVNQLFANTIRSQKCNFLDIPTDCPQRDERMGWTGDASIFAPTACFHMNCGAFFRHYTRTLYLEQKLADGAVPFFAPMPKVPVEEHTNPFYLDGGACVWGDAATMLPWTLYQYYGDRELLKEQYPMMRDWVEHVRCRVAESEVPDLWLNDRHLGDWLALDNGNIHNPIGKTDSNFVASAYYYWSVLILAKAAEVLEFTEREEYQLLAERIKKAFIEFYFGADGSLQIEPTQTACALLLHIDLYPEYAKKWLVTELRHQIQSNAGKLNTGFVGTPVLCLSLSENGLNDMAYDLLLNEDYPGWLYEVNMGATTVWERWNSLKEDGRISDMGMNSLNHYVYGSIANWMYRYMCGFRPDMSSEIMMTIQPMPDKRFSFVKGKWESVYGTYISDWTYDEKKGYQFYIEIPFMANAKVILPNGRSYVLEHGKYRFGANRECL